MDFVIVTIDKALKKNVLVESRQMFPSWKEGEIISEKKMVFKKDHLERWLEKLDGTSEIMSIKVSDVMPFPSNRVREVEINNFALPDGKPPYRFVHGEDGFPVTLSETSETTRRLVWL